jgi:hypothetical protein
MPWQFHPITTFAQHSRDWDRLAEATGGVPFLTSRFLGPALTHLATGSERLALCVEAGEAKAMTIVVRRAPGVWQTFQPSQLPLGPWVMSADDSIYGRANALLRGLPGWAVRLGVTQLDPAIYPRPPASGTAATVDYIETAFVEVAGTFEDYWSERGKNLRANMKKQRRKLAADGVAARFEVLTRPQEMAEAVASYGRLESAGWKAAGGTAISAENVQGRFYRTMLEAFCEAGRGRVYRLCFDDRVVAVDLCIDGGDMEVVLKTTYDETVKSLSPASLLREEEFASVFREHRVQRVEFFGRMMEWHTHWARQSRMLYHLNVSRFAWLDRVRSIVAKRGPR